MLLNAFHEANITLMSKPDKDTTFIYKDLQKVDTEETYLNIIKVIYDKPKPISYSTLKSCKHFL